MTVLCSPARPDGFEYVYFRYLWVTKAENASLLESKPIFDIVQI